MFGIYSVVTALFHPEKYVDASRSGFVPISYVY